MYKRCRLCFLCFLRLIQKSARTQFGPWIGKLEKKLLDFEDFTSETALFMRIELSVVAQSVG